jgi:hypothetical protein
MTRNMPHYQLNLKFRAKKELGSLSRGKLGLRVVVSSTTEGTHQPVGDESSSFGEET